MIIKALYSRKT